MTKNILFTTIFALLAVFGTAQAQKTKVSTTPAKSDVKFLDDISVEVTPVQSSDPKAVFTQPQFTAKKAAVPTIPVASIENASNLQLKYALLLDIEVEMVQNLGMFKVIDEWLGTRYRLGGTTRDGIDCSALMQVLFSSLYGVTLPRTAREQHSFTKRVSRAEIKEGDLVFFNTVGGVSHVGMYLQNNKFLHASKNGVTISDLYEDYWLRHFVGAGRVDPPAPATALNSKP